MKRILFLLLTFTSVHFCVCAQGTSIGLSAGYVGDIGWDKIVQLQYYHGVSKSISVKAGYQVGAVLDYQITDYLSLGLQGVFIQRVFNHLRANLSTGTYDDRNVVLNSLSFPMYFAYKLPINRKGKLGFHVLAGTNADFILKKGKVLSTLYGREVRELKVDITRNLSTLSFGWMTETPLYAKSRLQVAFFYLHPIRDNLSLTTNNSYTTTGRVDTWKMDCRVFF